MTITDRAVVRTVRITVATGGGLAVVGSAVLIAGGHADFWFNGFLAALAVIGVCFAVLAWLVIPGQPRNAAVWTMAISSSCGLYVAGAAAMSLLVAGDPAVADTAAPSDLPASVAWARVVTAPGFGVGFSSLVTFGFLLFPDGTLPSRRWRPVGWLTAVSIAVITAALAFRFRPTNTGDPFAGGGPLEWAIEVHLLCAVLSLAALMGRFRHSRGATRQQFKWVVWGAAIYVPIFVVTVVLGEGPYEHLMRLPFLAALAVLLVSYGIAVGRYRLYDIDLVISRTLVYGALAVFVTSVYVAAVVGIGRLAGRGGEPDTAVAIAATATVAVVFQPLRRRLRHVVDRVVHGRTATPHEVLSEFGRRVAATDESLLDQVARSLVGGTAADRAAVWVTVGGRLVKAAEWPEGGRAPEHGVVSCQIEHDGVPLGQLTLSTPAGQHVSEEDLHLAGQVASGMGLALRNRVLTSTLRGRVDQLRESRRRLMTARDEARRQIERDLHDGAQQHLVALKVKLGLAQAVAGRDGAPRTAAKLGELADRAEGAVDALRDVARGVYPPLLEAEGLGPAITAHARRLPAAVSVDVDGTGRYDRRTEATAYFCVVETLHHIADDDRIGEVHVRLLQADGALTFAIRHNGTASADAVSARNGLVDVTDRLDAANGTLTLRSEPGHHTVITGSIPTDLRT